MGRNTANAIQFAKIVSKMMISKVLDGETQDHNNNTHGGLVNSQLTPKGISTEGYNLLGIT